MKHNMNKCSVALLDWPEGIHQWRPRKVPFGNGKSRIPIDLEKHVPCLYQTISIYVFVPFHIKKLVWVPMDLSQATYLTHAHIGQTRGQAAKVWHMRSLLWCSSCRGFSSHTWPCKESYEFTCGFLQAAGPGDPGDKEIVSNDSKNMWVYDSSNYNGL